MLGRIFGRRASLYWILQNRLFLLSFSIYSIFLYLAPNSWYIIDIKPFYWSMKPHFHLDLRFSTLHMYYLETNVYHIGLSLRYSSHQSCQQATFFRPGLACCLAWYDLRCLQARPKIKDRPAAWPGLAWPAGRTSPSDVDDFSNSLYSIILYSHIESILLTYFQSYA
jgi:hypothetical protein